VLDRQHHENKFAHANAACHGNQHHPSFQQFPWARFGSIEVRPVRDMQAVRMRVGAV
jgi:hypothetical protein